MSASLLSRVVVTNIIAVCPGTPACIFRYISVPPCERTVLLVFILADFHAICYCRKRNLIAVTVTEAYLTWGGL